MNNFIYEPKTSTEALAGAEYYSVEGHHDYIDNNFNPRINNETDSRVLAKKIIRDDGSIKYSIKTDAGGKFQNPVSIYSQEKNINFLDRICRSSDRFKEVNFKTFNMYLTFLKTKNLAWLHNAERESE